MKTFLNVLYRRILYRIPLKFLLVLLVVCAVFIACFSSAVDIPTANWQWNIDDYNGLYDYVHERFQYSDSTLMEVSSSIDFVCLKRRDANNGAKYSFDWTTWYNTFNYERGCTDIHSFYIKWDTLITYFKFWQWLIPIVYDSIKCQTEYSLIPISSVDQEYCTSNNLCPSQDCPVWTWWISSVYINDILHVGAPFIYMNIPEEIDWDYAYTQWWTNMNIDVVWYNQDTEKIEWIITVQNYKPNSSDFTSLVSNAIPLFVPWLCIILLLYFIFRFIKKIF